MIRDMINGYAQRIRLENMLQLQKAKHVRPAQIKLEISDALKTIADRLQDPDLKKIYDGITLEVPA